MSLKLFDVLVPLFAFMIGLGVHHKWVRWLRATTRREELRFKAQLLDTQSFAKHLQDENVRAEIEKLIQDTKR